MEEINLNKKIIAGIMKQYNEALDHNAYRHIHAHTHAYQSTDMELIIFVYGILSICINIFVYSYICICILVSLAERPQRLRKYDMFALS